MSTPEGDSPTNGGREDEPSGSPARGEASGVSRGTYSEEFRYQAPIPPPVWMELYDQIVPGSAKQMIDDMDVQSAHRREVEREEARAKIAQAKRGQWFGFVTAVGGFVVVMTGMVGGLESRSKSS